MPMCVLLELNRFTEDKQETMQKYIDIINSINHNNLQLIIEKIR